MTKIFSEKLKRLMFEKNLKQEDFAKKIGVNQSHVSNWITGKRNPSIKTLNKIAKTLDVPISSLIENIEKNNLKFPYTISEQLKEIQNKIKDLEINFLKLEKDCNTRFSKLEIEISKRR